MKAATSTLFFEPDWETKVEDSEINAQVGLAVACFAAAQALSLEDTTKKAVAKKAVLTKFKHALPIGLEAELMQE